MVITNEDFPAEIFEALRVVQIVKGEADEVKVERKKNNIFVMIKRVGQACYDRDN